MKAIAVAALLLALHAPIVASAAAPSKPPTPSDVSAPATRKVDVNRATATELVAVPGIGPRLAQAIVELRESRGSFATLDDLLEVRGIGEKNLAHFADYLTVAQPVPGAPVASQTK